MFVRVKKIAGHEYLQVVHGYREKGQVKQRVLMTLGKAGEASTYDNIDSLMHSLQKFSYRSAVLSAKYPDIDCQMKIIGPVMIFERLWTKLGIGDAIKNELKGRMFEFDVERAIFVSVLHRLLRSGSDLNCSTWMQRYEISGSGGLELQHLYRAMGFLGEKLRATQAGPGQFVRRIKDKIEEAIYLRDYGVFSEFKMVFFDTTSTYFEGAGGKELGKRGYSKDSRPDLHQVIVGALLDEKGVPICCEVLPGNTADLKTIIPVTQRIRQRFGFWNYCIVADRGMISNPTLQHFQEQQDGLSFILGCRIRKDAVVKSFLQNQAIDWEKENRIDRAGKERIYYKEVALKQGQRHVICYSELQASKDAITREEIITQLQSKLNDDFKTLVSNAGYRRYLKTSGKKLEIDTDKIQAEAVFDGIWVLQTNTDLTAEDVVMRYKDLWQVEYVFRTMKSTFNTRPIFHQKDEPIVGHIFCSFLALVLMKELISLLDREGHAFSWSQIVDDLNSLGYLDINTENKNFRVRTNVSGCTSKIFSAVGVGIPKSIIM